ncbi:MAG: pantoate--beta-alanine ligase [SAR202 cluster bacterium]|nr:pantoate--beta-alanine ligase [SAR202 cluster bacterium]
MRVVETVADFRRACGAARRPLGLVPTMGGLHAGHLALVKRSKAECATTAATIFVNPAQFGPKEDFNTYPRNLWTDLDMFESEGVDLVFTPPVEEVYPTAFDTWVNVGKVSSRLEGEARPGHFRGVATVVTKLLAIARPDRAYFGQKDAQQCLVIKQLNDDLALGAVVVIVPTVREPDGLALSSRNVNLRPDERRAAPVLYRALCLAQKMQREGTNDAEAICRAMREEVGKERLAQVDYVSISDAATLEDLERVDRPALALLAVRIGKTRLIDNIAL